MLPEYNTHFLLKYSSTAYYQIDHSISLRPFASAIVILLYILWYLWTFNISPTIFPDEPRPLPYWVPLIGHTIRFFRDRDALFEYGHTYFKANPYTLYIAGKKFYILTSPQAISAVYKQNTTLSFDGSIQDFYKGFSMSPMGLQQMWKTATDFSSVSPSVVPKSLIQQSKDLGRAQLTPGTHMENLTRKVLPLIERGTNWGTLPASSILLAQPEKKTISLYRWCFETLTHAMTVAFFGETLSQTEPQLSDDFRMLDENGWMLLYRYPWFLANGMSAPKEKVLQALIRYINLPLDRRSEAAYYLQSLEAQQVRVGMNDRDRAIHLQICHWAMNTNTFKLCFWLLAHIIYDPKLYNDIQIEVSRCVLGNDLDIESLTSNCSILNATVDETLRYTNASPSVRSVLKSTTIGDKTLRQGAMILMPHRVGHFNEEKFGSNVNEFDPQRFIRNKNLNQDTAYRPFGGGSTMCSGRFIARREVVAFVAFVLDRYEIELCQNGGGSSAAGTKTIPIFPRLDKSRPNIGIIHPVKGDDVLIEVKPRKRKRL